MSDNPSIYESGGLVMYRASALGGCLRSLALARQGYEAIAPPETMQQVYAAGHEAERQAFIKGWVNGQAQEVVSLRISDGIVVLGHMDAWEPERIYDVKSQSEAEWKPIQESPLWGRYAWQFSVYMLGTGLPMRVVRVLRDKDGNISDRVDEDIAEPPHSLAEVRQRVFQVEMMARKDLSDVKCETVMFPCPYFYTHSQDATDGRQYLDDDGAAALAKQYVETGAEVKRAKERNSAAKQALLTWMEGKDKVEVPGWRVTVYEVDGRHVEFEQKGYKGIRVTEVKKKGGESAGTGDE